MIFGFNEAHNFNYGWLFVIPVLLTVGICWGSFPAFCRCPDCKRRMRQRDLNGKITQAHAHFNEVGPTKHFLVCEECKVCMLLGETDVRE